MLIVDDINFKIPYVAVKDNLRSSRTYFSQGEQAEQDIRDIEEHGLKAFLWALEAAI